MPFSVYRFVRSVFSRPALARRLPGSACPTSPSLVYSKRLSGEAQNEAFDDTTNTTLSNEFATLIFALIFVVSYALVNR
jgi:hypothetical protein